MMHRWFGFSLAVESCCIVNLGVQGSQMTEAF